MDDNDRFPEADWRDEIGKGFTRLGYDAWVAQNIEFELSDQLGVPTLYHEGFPVAPMFSPDPKIPTGEMTRGQQTAWIVGAIAIAAGGWFYYDTRLPDGHPSKECQGVLFMDDRCLANQFTEQMTGQSLDGYGDGASDVYLEPLEPAMPPE